jgi:UDP-glucose 4-epimerase
MRALVTGGAGFIGSHLVDGLLADGHEVVVVDDLSTGDRGNVNPASTFVEGDVGEAEVATEVMNGIDVVFHEAAIGSVRRSVERPLATDQANVHGTLAIFDGAVRSGVRRVVFASSSSVYGGADVRPTPESTPLRPRSPYAVSKLAGEWYARVFHDLHGLETVGLRYFNVYGPRQRHDSPYSAVIPRWIDALRQGTEPLIFGDGEQTRDFTFVADAVSANLAAAVAPSEACAGQMFNIGGGAEHSLLAILELIQDLMGTQIPPRFEDARSGDVRSSRAAIEAARESLGFEPSVTLRDGLDRTIAASLAVG